MPMPTWVEKILSPVITAAVVGAGGYFVALPVMENKLKNISEQVMEIKAYVKANTEEIGKLRERTATNEANIENIRRKNGDFR